MNKETVEDLLNTDSTRLDLKTTLWSLKTAFKGSPLTFTLWTVIQLIAAIFPAIFTGMISRTIDTVENNVSAGLGIESILWLLIALTIIMIGNGIFTQLPNVFWMELVNNINIVMQKIMGRFMRTVPVRYFDDPRTAKIMSIAQRREGSLGSFVGNFMCIVQTIVYLISMLVLAITTSWILVIFMVVYIAFAVFLGTKSAKDAYAADKDLEEDYFYNDYYMNMVMKKNPKDMRLLSMGSYINKKWKKHRQKILDTDNSFYSKDETLWSLTGTTADVAKFLLLLIGLFLLSRQMLTLGSLTIFLSALTSISGYCLNLGYNWKRFYQNGCDMTLKKRMLEWDFSGKRPLPEWEASPTKAKSGEAPIIFEAQNVSFSYDNDKNVLENISFCIHEGESVALVGENGAGKSTLVKLLLGIYEPDGGELFYKGCNYRNLDMTKFVDDIGVVFQDFVHFELLLRENIAFGDISKVNDDESILRAATLGGAEKIVEKLPKRLDTYLGRWYEKDGGEMSGGEWQRVAVSRAYISDRKILIMDEPAAALDPIAEMEQFSQIRNKLKNRTSVLISHRIGFARLADRIIVLNKGKMVEMGTHEDLMAKKGLYYDMFYNQASWYQNGGAVNE